jgi:hypothetical protein
MKTSKYKSLKRGFFFGFIRHKTIKIFSFIALKIIIKHTVI